MLSKRPMRDNDFAVTLARIVLQSMNEENREGIIGRLTSDFDPDVQVKLYEFTKTMIRSWAGQTDLSREDAGIIEDCRKICDMMGWPPERW